MREPPESVHDGDLHLLAIEDGGELHAYLTMKQPHGIQGDVSFRERERALFPTEQMHGRAWQREITGSTRSRSLRAGKRDASSAINGVGTSSSDIVPRSSSA